MLLNNIEVNRPSKDIYMMHQHYANFPFKTCIENVLFPISIKREIDKKDIKLAINILNDVGLIDYRDKYPSELSGGMNQRLALARALIIEPSILLMDEPMSALDIDTRTKMQDLVLKMQRINKSTIIMVTHDNNEANKMADYIIKF